MNPNAQMFSDIFPSTGNVVLSCTTDKGYMRNYTSTVDNLPNAISMVDQLHDAVYWSIATFNEVGDYSGRKIDNAVAVKCLTLDIDVKDTQYARLSDAIQGLTHTLKTIGLPVPYIVSSGGGLHVYFPLTKELTVAEWQPLARLFAACVSHTGLQYDTGLTVNPVVLLRPVGATHRKDPSNPRTVTLLKPGVCSDVTALTELLTEYKTAHGIEVAEYKAKVKLSPEWHAIGLELGFVEPQQPHDAQQIIDQCAAIRNCADEPQWRLALTVLRLCEDGDAWCHSISATGETYDEEAVDRKLWGMDQSHGTGKPAYCDTFALENDTHCASCIHRNRIKSPITLGKPLPVTVTVEQETKPLPEPPAPVPVVTTHDPLSLVNPDTIVLPAPKESVQLGHYMFTVRNDSEGFGLYIKEQTDNGDERLVPICNQIIYPLSIVTAKDTMGNKIWHVMWRVQTGFNNKPIDYLLPFSATHKDSGLISAFSDFGIIIPAKKHWATFGLYMRALTQEAREHLPVEQTREQLGWDDEGNYNLGTDVAMKDATLQRAVNADELSGYTNARHTKAGNVDEWRDAVNVWAAEGQEAFAFAMGAAFGAPLMKFTGQRGAILSLHGATGAGKSTLQEAIASVWGNPKRQLIKAPGSKLGDTLLSFMRSVVLLNNMPVCMEEITNMPVQDVSDLVYTLSLGQEKTRMQRNNTTNGFGIADGDEWQTLFVSSSNRSLRGMLGMAKLDALAEEARVIELMNLKPNSKDFEGDRVRLAKLSSNYGVAGVIYARWLAVNHDVLQLQVEDEVRRISGIVHAQQHDRFQVALLACCMLGLRIAQQAGLITYDLQRVEAFALTVFEDQRIKTAQVSGATFSHFDDMMTKLTENVLIMSGAESHIPTYRPRTLEGRVEVQNKVMYLSRTAVRKWAKVNGLSVDAVLDSAVVNGNMHPDRPFKRISLHKGVDGYAEVRPQCYVFKLSDETCANFDDQEKTPVD